MDNYTDVSYKEVPTDEECSITAVKIGKIINEPASTIRKWAEYHEDNLYIKKINGRMVYSEKSIKQFEFIKDLRRNKGMTHGQIKDYMKEHGIEYRKYSTGLINPEDPFGYEVLSSALAQQTEKKLKQFLNAFMEYQEENNKNLVNTFKDCMDNYERTMQEQVSESIKPIEEELKLQKETLTSIEQELLVTKKMNEKLDNLRQSMEARKEESEKEKKSFWSRLFNR